MPFDLVIEEPIKSNDEVLTYCERRQRLVPGHDPGLPLNRYSFLPRGANSLSVADLIWLLDALLSRSGLHATWLESWALGEGLTATPARFRLRLSRRRREGFEVIMNGNMAVAVKSCACALDEDDLALGRFAASEGLALLGEDDRIDVLSPGLEKTFELLSAYNAIHVTDSLLGWLLGNKRSCVYIQQGSDMSRTCMILVGWQSLGQYCKDILQI